jgi:hypothetical protein
MPLDDESLRNARSRIDQVFAYLQALNELRNPVIRRLDEQPWVLRFRDLPPHPSILKGRVPDGDNQPAAVDDFILRVGRPQLTPPPAPPVEIVDWLRDGWDELDGAVEVHASRNETDAVGQTQVVRFEEDPVRVDALEEWRLLRSGWADNERPARDASRVFERLYELRGRLQREAERVELVLGDGILNWRRPEGGIHHPVLLQRLQLEFDPDTPEFIFRETQHPTELHSALFRSLSGVDGTVIGRYQKEADRDAYHPLGGTSTAGLLRQLVQELDSQGKYLEDGEPRGEANHPRMGRSAVIFLRARSLGFATALQAVREDLKERQDLPPSLLGLVGVEPPPPADDPDGSSTVRVFANEDTEILLTKPANAEQLQIARRLDRFGSVLVQGPPGTGKTHTIANLIGHVLARGESVLITSHTAKALRVLHQQITDELKPLSVSVLESDAEGQEHLERSVNGITERLSDDPDALEADAHELHERRVCLVETLRHARSRLQDARANEYRPVIVAGQEYTPSDVARIVAKGRDRDEWIPGPVELAVPLPLSCDEVGELYATNASVSPEDERQLTFALPDPSALTTPEDFEQDIKARAWLNTRDRSLRLDLWGSLPEQCDPGDFAALLVRLLDRLKEAVASLRDDLPPDQRWWLAAIDAGRRGRGFREPWDELVRWIVRTSEEAARAQPLLVRYGPELSREHRVEDQIRLLDETITDLRAGGSRTGSQEGAAGLCRTSTGRGRG